MDRVRISKKLSLHLRHAPEQLGITLQPGGWVPIEELLNALAEHGFPISRDDLDEVVASSDKQRFAFDESGTRIRANQGHSVQVDLDLAVTPPPPVLYHGTPAKFVDAIFDSGLRPMNRHHVHLSETVDTATRVGARRGVPVVLRVDSARMAADGHEFLLSANGVWLTDSVPAHYLSTVDQSER